MRIKGFVGRNFEESCVLQMGDARKADDPVVRAADRNFV